MSATDLQARIDAWVDRQLANFPPLTDEQITGLAELLRPHVQAAIRKRHTPACDLGGDDPPGDAAAPAGIQPGQASEDLAGGFDDEHIAGGDCR
ncbi:hypothetical protein AAFP35_24260 [Gordonia sp. CPCC 206044]|uniref:hypothetical protein n=1 Tax=Gordonia sp. CPCC 206044 TaxID=3140793 RepID=UPI003AF3BC33